MNFSFCILVALFFGFECRSIHSSTNNDAIMTESKTLGGLKGESVEGSSMKNDIESFEITTPIEPEISNATASLNNDKIRRFFETQELKLEKILTDFVARIVDVKSFDEKASQWLGFLKQMLRLLSSTTGIVKSRGNLSRFDDIDEIERILIRNDNQILPISELENFLGLFDECHDGNDDIEKNVQSRYENSSTVFSLIDNNWKETKDVRNKSSQYSFEEMDRMLVGVQNDIARIQRYFEKLCSKHHAMTSTTPNAENHNGDGNLDIVRTKNP